MHHAYFVREVAKAFPVARALGETDAARAPFETAHPFEAEGDAFEREVWFDGREARVGDFAPTETVPSMNDGAAVAALTELAPDAVIVFGTGRLKPPVISIAADRIFNLHGGDPEAYLGASTPTCGPSTTAISVR